MKPYYSDPLATLYHGDCIEVMASLPAESVDAIVTDPPYGLGKEPDIAALLTDWLSRQQHDQSGGGFMGKTWDSIVPGPRYWRQTFRVMKPGAHLLAFGGTRTYDLLVIALRLAGFEIRDTINCLYGSGFPKNHNVSKAIDKMAGAEREVVGQGKSGQTAIWEQDGGMGDYDITTPATDDAIKWDGWGTALKPAHELIVLARKPLSERNIAANVLKHGTGVINVDGCRVSLINEKRPSGSGNRCGGLIYAQDEWTQTQMANNGNTTPQSGRWPPNLLLTHDSRCELVGADWRCVEGCPVKALGEQSGVIPPSFRPGDRARYTNTKWQGLNKERGEGHNLGFTDQGTAARFFPQFAWEEADFWPFRYMAKASRAERNRGDAANSHATVKPVALMKWLITLITPPGGIVLDPFAGSGTTLMAAKELGFRSVGIEMQNSDAEPYCEIAKRRIIATQPGLL